MKKHRVVKNIDYMPEKKRLNLFSSNKIILYFLGFLLIGLMVGSMFGYMGDDDEEGVEKYKGFEFKRMQGMWVTKINNVGIGFDYLPIDVENITIEEFSLPERVYVMFDPSKMSYDTYDVRNMIAVLQFLGKSVNPACNKDCDDWPVKDCNIDTGIVYIKEGGENRIYNQKGCIVLSGSDLLKVETRFYYRLFGVI